MPYEIRIIIESKYSSHWEGSTMHRVYVHDSVTGEFLHEMPLAEIENNFGSYRLLEHRAGWERLA
jgi:hypothetical protein